MIGRLTAECGHPVVACGHPHFPAHVLVLVDGERKEHFFARDEQASGRDAELRDDDGIVEMG
jgi:hypothetical protein